MNSKFLPWIVWAVGVVIGCSTLRADTVTDPRITSWVTSRSYARVYETASDKTSGNAVTTWPRSGLTNGGGGQAIKVYSDVQRVVYSSNYVYVYVTGLPSYTMGNWVTPNNMTYTSWPTNRAAIHRIPRANVSIATVEAITTKTKTNGSGGVLVNGVYVWANGDAQSYNTSTGVVSMQGGQGIWNRLAGVAENFNFDPAKGHQPSSGAYHNHVNPIALRYQLGDNVTYNAATKAYADAANPTEHSPLIGWANDGLPIYGPYGYSSAMDASSGVRRMTSGFVKRDGQTLNKNTQQPNTNLAATGRTTLPVWAASVQGKSTTLSSSEYGPNTTTTYQVGGGVTSTYSIGLFAEDYDYLGDLGYTQGVDFDLNRQNVRKCVTPEFPNGTYAYFVCIDSSGSTVFPDIINQEYFGSVPAGSPGAGGQGTVTSISETVTEYARGGQASPIAELTAEASGDNVQLSWPSVEGGTYTVATSQDDTTYTTLSTSVASAGTTTTYTTATQAPYYKVTLNAVATYDTNGNGGVTGVNTSTAKVYHAAGASAPAITTQPSGQTVVAGASVTFSVGATGTPALSYQWYKNGAPVPFAASASYTIGKTTSASAGVYTVVVTNALGSVTSEEAALVVNGPPAITTQPVAQTVSFADTVVFSVEATGTGDLAYRWRKDNVDLSEADQPAFQIDAASFGDAGNYTVVVTNAYGSTTSAAAKLTVTVPAPVLSLSGSIPTTGPVNTSLAGDSSYPGLQYFATGLPAGLTLNASTGQITGKITAKPGAYTVTYWAQYGSTKSAVTTATINVTAFPVALSGTFEALLLADADGYTGLPAAKVTLTVGTTGAFTGQIVGPDAKTSSFKGTLALDDDYASGSASVSVSRGTGLAPYALTLAVDSDGVFSASVSGLGATDQGAKLATFAKGVSAPWTGAYTLAIASENGGDGRFPRGNGYATASISSAGLLKVSGKLADGTALTASFSVASDGRVFWYGKPYKTVGNYFGGTLYLTRRSDQAGRYQGGSAEFFWRKPAASSDKLFPAGFGPLATSVEMQRWDAPSSTVNLAARLGLNSSGDTLVALGDGSTWFAAGDTVNTVELTVPLALSSTGTASVTGGSNPSSFMIKLTPKTGAFSGSFKIGSRSVPFQGVLLQEPQPIIRGGSVLGFGYFMLPEGKADPVLTGSIQFIAP